MLVLFRTKAIAASLPFGAILFGSVLAATGCSSPAPSAASACSVHLSGNVTGSASLPSGCAVLTRQGDGGADTLLSVRGTSTGFPGLAVTVDLGPSPTLGAVSSDNLPTWNVVGLAAAGSDCTFSAGNTSVPAGTLSLELTSFELGDAAATGVAHGSLDVQGYVHAPPATDCGPGDVEQVTIVF